MAEYKKHKLKPGLACPSLSKFPPGNALDEVESRRRRICRRGEPGESSSRFGAQLEEGLPCATGGKHCSQAELASIYSQNRFVDMYAVLRARDWVCRCGCGGPVGCCG